MSTQPALKTPVSRPLWRIGRRTNREPIAAHNNPQGHLAYSPPQQTAMMMRPVPIGAPLPAENSTWAPVQRVRADGLPEGGTSSQPVPSSLSTQPGLEAPLVPIPAPESPAIARTGDGKADAPVKDDKGDNGSDKADKGKSGTLPPPRSTSGNKKAGTTNNGWPALPPPVITNPPHAPREFQKHALSTYIIEPPDVLQIEGSQALFDKQLPITGSHLVRPDGSIGLGTYGSVFVAGMTVDQAKTQIIAKIRERQDLKPQDLWDGIKVDVVAFNSKFYYVITDGGGYGEAVVRVPCTGNETVLDAISQIQGLPAVASKKQIWIARATPNDGHAHSILPVDWCRITQRGSSLTNYQIFPGDRVYVNSQKLIRVDSKLAKILSPIERLFGVTLLGATTVNAVKGQSNFP
jgi:polysaccharide export outer membrane protein